MIVILVKTTMRYNWESKDLSAALNVSTNMYGNAVRINSSHIEKGDIFIALYNGKDHDGHCYLKHAFTNGASACVVNKDSTYIKEALDARLPLIQVQDTKHALKSLALYNRARMQGNVIAVTGSVGKTSVKNITSYLLKKCIKKTDTVFSSYKNFNNFLGTLINLASADHTALYSVFEVAMSNGGEIKQIVEILHPNISIITHVSSAHIQNFESTINIAYAKAEIFSYMNKDDIAIINDNSEHFSILKSEAKKKNLKIFTYGSCTTSHAFLKQIIPQNNVYLVDGVLNNRNITFTTSIGNVGIAKNILCAFLLLHKLSLLSDIAIEYSKQITPENGRGNLVYIPGQNIQILDYSYNANFTSVVNNLISFNLINKDRRKVLIIGDMLELGKEAIQYHIDLVQYVLTNKIDKVITVGSLSKHLFNALPDYTQLGCYDDYYSCIKNLKNLVITKDIIMIQGSRSMQMEKIILFLQEMS